MLVELVEDETHAVHEAVHVGWLAFVVGGSLVSSQRSLEGLTLLPECHSFTLYLDASMEVIRCRDIW